MCHIAYGGDWKHHIFYTIGWIMPFNRGIYVYILCKSYGEEK